MLCDRRVKANSNGQWFVLFLDLFILSIYLMIKHLVHSKMADNDQHCSVKMSAPAWAAIACSVYAQMFSALSWHKACTIISTDMSKN